MGKGRGGKNKLKNAEKKLSTWQLEKEIWQILSIADIKRGGGEGKSPTFY